MTIAEIAAQAGTTVVEVVEDYGNAVYDLAEATFIGETQLALGMPEGQALVDASASLMADLSSFIGVDINAVEPLEVGAATAVYRAAAKYLKAGAASVAKVAATRPGGVVKAILAIGLVSTSYMWFTQDLQVRLADVERAKHLGSLAIAKMTPEQAAASVGSVASGEGFRMPWWGWPALAIGGGLLAWRKWFR